MNVKKIFLNSLCFVITGGELDRTKWEHIEVLKSLPEDCPEIVMPTYAVVDLKRIRSTVHKCIENGVMSEECEGAQWNQFLDREEEKQKVIEFAE